VVRGGRFEGIGLCKRSISFVLSLVTDNITLANYDRDRTYLTATLLLSSRLLLLRTRLVGVERRLLDGRRGVVGAGLAVLVGLGLEGVFVLGVFAGKLHWSLGKGPAGDDKRGAGAGGEEGAA
jgi:hypothetical protein